jgi:hypothetical protein
MMMRGLANVKRHNCVVLDKLYLANRTNNYTLFLHPVAVAHIRWLPDCLSFPKQNLNNTGFFALFRFQLDTLIILYIYNLGFYIYLYMFRTDWSIIRRSNAFIAQAASDTVPSVVVCLGRPLVLESNNNGRPRQTTTK